MSTLIGALLTTLATTKLHESACDFSFTQDPSEVFAEVTRLQQTLISGVERFLLGQPPPPIAALIRKLK